MRGPLVIVLCLVTAGCLTGGPDEEGPEDDAAPSFSALLCGSGLKVQGVDLGCLRLASPENGPANEVSVAIDPTDPGNVVGGAKDYTLGKSDQCGEHRVWSGHYWSGNGGLSWEDDLLAGHPGDDRGSAIRGYACTTDPVLVFGPDGTAYYSGLAYGRTFELEPDGLLQGKGSNVFIAVSHDGGRTFEEVHVVAEADGDSVFHDKQWFAVDPRDPDRLYMTWSMFVIVDGGPVGRATQYTNLIVESHSTDGGVTWSPPQTLADVGNQQVDVQFSMPVVTNDGVVHVIFMDFRTSAIQYTRSTDAGESWSPPRPILETNELPSPLPNTAFRVSTYPVMAADTSGGAHDGSLYVVWADHGQGHADILVSTSRDGGDTWTGPVRVNDDATDTDQFMPWIAVGPDGLVHATWFDRRGDADNTLVGVHYATSADGRTWTPNLEVAPPFDADLGIHQGGGSFIGDYIGLAVGHDRAVVLFPGTYTGESLVYAGLVPRDAKP